MALRASRSTEQRTRSGRPSTRALRASAIPMGLAVMFSCLVSAPLTAQVTAAGHATVQIGQVSELDVNAYGGSGSDSEAVRVQVRANHQWKVVLAAGYEAPAPIWVYAADASGTTREYRVEAGSEVVVASGSSGERVVEMELRWEESAYSSVASLPITYTLASSDG